MEKESFSKNGPKITPNPKENVKKGKKSPKKTGGVVEKENFSKKIPEIGHGGGVRGGSGGRGGGGGLGFVKQL